MPIIDIYSTLNLQRLSPAGFQLIPKLKPMERLPAPGQATRLQPHR